MQRRKNLFCSKEPKQKRRKRKTATQAGRQLETFSMSITLCNVQLNLATTTTSTTSSYRFFQPKSCLFRLVASVSMDWKNDEFIFPLGLGQKVGNIRCRLVLYGVLILCACAKVWKNHIRNPSLLKCYGKSMSSRKQVCLFANVFVVTLLLAHMLVYRCGYHFALSANLCCFKITQPKCENAKLKSIYFHHQR